MKWTFRNASYESIEALQERFNLNLITAKVLAGRGITSYGKVRFYLEEDVSFLHNPFMFEDMETLCDRILQAVEDGEKVHVFGDRDVDGITSTVLMVHELKRLGLDVSYSLPMGDDPYGISKSSIDKIAENGVTLCVTVDCGISCIEEVTYARKKGIDFIVTDHHIPSEIIPPAVAIIDPKVEGSGYPFDCLAGCGVVAKCIWAIRFSQTPLYRQSFIMLHAQPGNDTVIIEAAKVENMLVTDRISEEVVYGCITDEESRLIKFLSCGLEIYVYDSESELLQLKKAFPKADISLTDIKDGLEKSIPSIKGKSLFALNNQSRFALYSQTRSELDTLIGLMFAHIRVTYPLLYREYKTVMDLVAIGTISDLMPMLDENRIMVKTGFKVLENGNRKSLLPILGMQNLLRGRLSTTDISWQLSPLLNASGRLGKPDVALNMILSTTDAEASILAQQLNNLNRERQKLGEDAWKKLLPLAQDNFEKMGSKFVLVYEDSIPRGITGIIATRLQKYFKAPSMIITKTQNGRVVGSIRSSANFDCHAFLSKYCDLFDDYGGHKCAGGFTLSPDKIDELSIRISEDVDYMDCPEEEEVLEIDVKLPPEYFKTNIIHVVESLEPYGESNTPVVFMVEGATITNLNAMQNQKDPSSNHLRMNIEYGSSSWPAVFWSAGQRVGKDFDNNDTVDVAFQIGRNYYRNQETVQLTILDIKRH